MLYGKNIFENNTKSLLEIEIGGYNKETGEVEEQPQDAPEEQPAPQQEEPPKAPDINKTPTDATVQVMAQSDTQQPTPVAAQTPDVQAQAGGEAPPAGDDNFDVDTSDAGNAPQEPVANEDDTNFDIDTSDEGNADGEAPAEGGEGGDDFDIDTSDEGNDGEGEGEVPADANGEQPPAEEGGSGSKLNDELAELEDKLFDSLSDIEKEVKKKELRNLYGKLYTSCDTILDKISQVPKCSDNMDLLKRIISNIEDVKEYSRYYLEELFEDHTYIENKTYLEKMISILNGIKTVIMQLDNKK